MNMLTFFVVYSALAILPWIAAIVLAVRRSLMAPVCCECGARKVIRTSDHRVRDILPMMSLMVPLRCGGCLARYYGFRGINPAKNKHSWETLPVHRYKPAVAAEARGSFFQLPEVSLRVRIAPAGRPAVAAVPDTAFTSDLTKLQHALRTSVSSPAAAESTVSR